MRKRIQGKKRLKIIQDWGCRCAYCGTCVDPKGIQIDHGIPLVLQDQVIVLGQFAQLPTTNLEDDWNLFPACFQCNNWKGGMTIKAFRCELGKQCERALRYSRNYAIAARFGLVEVVKRDAEFLMDRRVQMAITEFDVNDAVSRSLKSKLFPAKDFQ